MPMIAKVAACPLKGAPVRLDLDLAMLESDPAIPGPCYIPGR